jgi:hypothetical protein
MYERDINQRSFVAAYRHEVKVYEQNIFCADDDRVECSDQEGNVILTFTADCYVLTGGKNDKDRQQLGTVHMRHGDGVMRNRETWIFKPDDGGAEMPLHESDILKGEVHIARWYLEGKLHIKPKTKEGA